MKSIWMDHNNLPQFQSLEGEHKTDVLIIGGGLTGILCAYFLHKNGVNYILTGRRADFPFEIMISFYCWEEEPIVPERTEEIGRNFGILHIGTIPAV